MNSPSDTLLGCHFWLQLTNGYCFEVGAFIELGLSTGTYPQGIHRVIHMAYRKSVNKGASARKFRSQVGRTKAANLKAVMRGGIRL